MNTTPTSSLLPTHYQRQPQQELHRQYRRPQGEFRNVTLPRRGLLFDLPPSSKMRHRQQAAPKSFMLARKRNVVEFFPRMYLVNVELTQTLLYGHYQNVKWLDCNLTNVNILCVDLNFKDKCFVQLLGWEYLEYCEKVQVNNVEKKSFPFQHFHWWFQFVRPYCVRCGR